MRGKMPVTTASLIKFNKTCESVSQNIEKPESPEEVRAFLALCPFAIFKLKVGVY